MLYLIRPAIVAMAMCSLAQSALGAETAPELTPDSPNPPPVDLAAPQDVDALRLIYARRMDFERRCERRRPEDQFMAHVNKKEYAAAAQVAEAWLKNCPVDARVHMWASAANEEAGNPEGAALHRRWFTEITDSVLKTGDGKTPQSPMVTISLSEEYAVLMRHRLTLVERGLLVHDQTPLDFMRVKDEEGRESTLYFYPKWHFIRLAQQVKEGRILN